MVDPPQPTVLPFRRSADRIDWYALAFTEKQFTALREELVAFVGPTYAGFRGQRMKVDIADPGDVLVAAFTQGRAFRLVSLGGDANRALLRVLELWRSVTVQRTERNFGVPRTTGRALYDFRIALLAGDRPAAEGHLRYLAEGQRLDALNTLFLRVQMLMAFQRWAEILGLPEIPTLLQLRRPFEVTKALIAAVYYEEIAPVASLDNPEQSAEHFAKVVFPRFALLYATRAGMQTPEALKSFMLVAVSTSPADPRLRAEILQTGGLSAPDRAMVSRLGSLLPKEPPPVPLHAELAAASAAQMRGDFDAAYELALGGPSGVMRTRILFRCAEEFQTLEAKRAALQALGALCAEERAELLSTRRDRELFRAWTGAEDTSPLAGPWRLPANWVEWLDAIDTSVVEADRLIDIARQATSEWDPGWMETPGAVEALRAAVLRSHSARADRILRESLPYLLGFLQQDPKWPQPGLIDTYEYLLFLVAAEARGGEAELNLFVELSSAVLTIGVEAGQYEALVDFAVELWERFASARTVTWVLDLVDLLAFHPSGSVDARLRMLVAVAEQLRRPKIARRIQREGWDFFRVLCHDLGHPEIYRDVAQHADESEIGVGAAEDVFGQLAGGTVGLYTLTDSVSQRVRDILLQHCATVEVSTSNDRACTERLKSLARSCDIFVVATGSAKHAATGCIEANRRTGQVTLRPTGKGSASMLAAISAYLSSRDLAGRGQQEYR